MLQCNRIGVGRSHRLGVSHSCKPQRFARAAQGSFRNTGPGGIGYWDGWAGPRSVCRRVCPTGRSLLPDTIAS
jgi:hypothetical protein